MSKSPWFIFFVLASVLCAGAVSEKLARKIEIAESTYKAAVQRADNAKMIIVQKASQERTRVLRGILSDATKAGDADAVADIKSRLATADLVEAISNTEWKTSGSWGRFGFKADGTMFVETWKGTARWMVIDENSVLINMKDEQVFSIDRIIFNNDRTKAAVHSIGAMKGVSFVGDKVGGGQ